jgi:hypothetical protein
VLSVISLNSVLLATTTEIRAGIVQKSGLAGEYMGLLAVAEELGACVLDSAIFVTKYG